MGVNDPDVPIGSPAIVVTGAAGAVGHAACEIFVRLGWTVFGIDVHNGDYVTSSIDLVSDFDVGVGYITDKNPVCVLHLAANKNVEEIERRPERWVELNVDLPLRLAKALSEKRIQLLFLSSDYVFDGSAGNYNEAAPCHPTTAYGKQKLLVERRLLDLDAMVTVIRAASIFGVRGDFPSAVLGSLLRQNDFCAFDDLITTPTFIGDLVAILTRIVDRRATGVFHAVGPDAISRLVFAETVAQVFDLPKVNLYGGPCDTGRPQNLSLNNEVTCKYLNYSPNRLAATLHLNKSLWSSGNNFLQK